MFFLNLFSSPELQNHHGLLSWDPIKLKLYGGGHFARQFPECHWWGIAQLILVLQASDVDCTSVKLWKRTYKVWLQHGQNSKVHQKFFSLLLTFLIVCLHECRLYMILSFFWKRRAADCPPDNAVLAHRHWIHRIKAFLLKHWKLVLYFCLNVHVFDWSMKLMKALAVEKFKHWLLQYLTFVQYYQTWYIAAACMHMI